MKLIGSVEVMQQTLDDIGNNVKDAYTKITDFLNKVDNAVQVIQKATKDTLQGSIR